MRIFISYPREFQEFAEKIEVELQNRHFDTFLDRHKINPSQAWTVEIERQIKRSKVFVILYDPEAAADETRYFGVEIDHIRKQLEGSLKPIRRVIFPRKHIVPVIFHPTTTNNLPPHLQCRQAVEAITNELTDKRNVPNWIHKVIAGVVKLRKDEQVRKFTLTTAAILTLAGIAMIAPRIPDPMPPATGISLADGKKTCEELKGRYNLWGSYTIIEEQDIKATSEAGKWETINCEKIAEPEGTYILNGQEETTHKVRVKINNIYEHVADAKNSSLSKLTINKDGRLVDRRISYPPDGKFHGIPTIEPLNPTGKLWKEHRNHIEKQLKKYEELVRQTHEVAERTMHCIPTRGKKKDNQGVFGEVIALICLIDPSSSNSPNYIRVMAKQD